MLGRIMDSGDDRALGTWSHAARDKLSPLGVANLADHFHISLENF